MKVKDARTAIEEAESEKVLQSDVVAREAIRAAEQARQRDMRSSSFFTLDVVAWVVALESLPYHRIPSLLAQDGIVFIDEIDKIVDGRGGRVGGSVSSEGVQRDLLPIIEGEAEG